MCGDALSAAVLLITPHRHVVHLALRHVPAKKTHLNPADGGLTIFLASLYCFVVRRLLLYDSGLFSVARAPPPSRGGRGPRRGPLVARFTGALQQPQPGAIATHMESLLRDLGDARDACNKLPFDNALRDKIATELDRIEAAPPLERMLVTKPPIKRWARLISRQKDPSIKTRRQAALTVMLRVVDRLSARGPSQGAACPSSLIVGTFHAPR